ncbi:MAG: diacylglycerol/lipid kinase family protein [Fimbriimonas sp.]
MKIVVIRNPVSGRGTGTKLWPQVEKWLQDYRPAIASLEIVTTTGPNHAVMEARIAAESADLIVACGGDGTIGDVANGLIGSHVPMGVVPMGTGNDLARHLGLQGNLERAVKIAMTGTPKPIDGGLWSVGEDSRVFFNACGCGFDAEVAARVNSGFRRLKGTAAYIAAVLDSLRSYEAVPIRITMGDQVVETEAMLCCVASAESYGGGMKIAPKASLTDGLLDVVLVRKATRMEFLRAFPSVFRGGHLGHRLVSAWQVPEVVIEPLSDAPPLVLADGELVGRLPGRFSVVPNALEVMQ